ncbi:hypothetical protein [Streptomyces tsukubensis]|uniref:hypothetical protein n=1 Tax=Streptomyces tsukubensis TaxID=83656 RepID=UPI00344E1A5F
MSSSGDLEAMRDRLGAMAREGVPGARLAAVRTRMVLMHLREAERNGVLARDAWRAIEQWDSGKQDEKAVHDALAKLLGDE